MRRTCGPALRQARHVPLFSRLGRLFVYRDSPARDGAGRPHYARHLSARRASGSAISREREASLPSGLRRNRSPPGHATGGSRGPPMFEEGTTSSTDSFVRRGRRGTAGERPLLMDGRREAAAGRFCSASVASFIDPRASGCARGPTESRLPAKTAIRFPRPEQRAAVGRGRKEFPPRSHYRARFLVARRPTSSGCLREELLFGETTLADGSKTLAPVNKCRTGNRFVNRRPLPGPSLNGLRRTVIRIRLFNVGGRSI